MKSATKIEDRTKILKVYIPKTLFKQLHIKIYQKRSIPGNIICKQILNRQGTLKQLQNRQIYACIFIFSSQSKECQPFLNPANESDKFFAPCGAIANSLFNDVITLGKLHCSSNTSQKARLLNVKYAQNKQQNLRWIVFEYKDCPFLHFYLDPQFHSLPASAQLQ